MEFFCVFALAMIVEGIVEFVKLAVPKLKGVLVIPLTIALGIAVCIFYGCDLLAVIGLVSPVPYVGNVLTGIIIARGSNYLYDLIGKLTEVKSTWGDPADGKGVD